MLAGGSSLPDPFCMSMFASTRILSSASRPQNPAGLRPGTRGHTTRQARACSSSNRSPCPRAGARLLRAAGFSGRRATPAASPASRRTARSRPRHPPRFGGRGLSAEGVDYINAHGTGTQVGDPAEVRAMSRARRAREIGKPTKSMTRHLLGAAGGGIACAGRRRRAVPPPSIDDPDPDCGAVSSRRRRAACMCAPLSSSMGFGGNNACLAFAAL